MFSFVNNIIKNAKIHDTITIENGIVLKLNIWTLTAEIIFSPNARGDIFIPRTIIHDSKSYIITEICDHPFDNTNRNISSIRFSEDSAIKVLNEGLLCLPFPLMINIPRNLERMEFNVFFLENNFKKLDFYSSNENFAFLDKEKKLVASRYSQNHNGALFYSLSRNNDFSEPFDNLLLAKNDITEAFIPSTIKNIDYYCFYTCKKLKKIEFEEPSSLQSICRNAFFISTIEEFMIPSKVSQLSEGWCMHTKKLTRLSVSPENNFFRMIENKILIGKTNDDDQVFNTLVFANRDVESVIIPSYIEIISPRAFEYCQNLQIVKFDNNSKLREIRSNAFLDCSSLNSIEIPENVELIYHSAFESCCHLKKVVFSMNAKLDNFSEFAFSYTDIKCLIVPPSVKQINKFAFFSSPLESIEFLGDNIDFEYKSINEVIQLKLLSFPNAKKVTFAKMNELNNLKNATLYIGTKGIIKLNFLESILNTFFNT